MCSGCCALIAGTNPEKERAAEVSFHRPDRFSDLSQAERQISRRWCNRHVLAGTWSGLVILEAVPTVKVSYRQRSEVVEEDQRLRVIGKAVHRVWPCAIFRIVLERISVLHDLVIGAIHGIVDEWVVHPFSDLVTHGG